jgi:hypothetical protein
MAKQDIDSPERLFFTKRGRDPVRSAGTEAPAGASAELEASNEP